MSDFNTIKNDTKTRMEKTIETLKGDFGSLRAGRAHVSLLDGIMVEAYGSPTPLAQVGTISVPDARTLSVSVWDRGLAKAVEKAIMEFRPGVKSGFGRPADSVFRFLLCPRSVVKSLPKLPANMPSRIKSPSVTFVVMRWMKSKSLKKTTLFPKMTKNVLKMKFRN